MQLILVLFFVAGALFYLGKRFFRSRSRQKGCEKCGTPTSSVTGKK